MNWFGEFTGSVVSAFWKTTKELKQQELAKSNDVCPDETKKLISRNLENCHPTSIDLTWRGRRLMKSSLDKNNYLSSLLVIDSNTKITKRKICIIALKAAAKCICSGRNADTIRAVTYKLSSIKSK